MILLFIIRYIQHAVSNMRFFIHNFNIRKSDSFNYHFNSLLTEIYNALYKHTSILFMFTIAKYISNA